MLALAIVFWICGALGILVSPPAGVGCFICALLCHLILAVEQVATRICHLLLRQREQDLLLRTRAEPTLVAPGPVIKPAQAPYVIALEDIPKQGTGRVQILPVPSVVPIPPPVQTPFRRGGGGWAAAMIVATCCGLVLGLMIIGIGIVAAQSGKRKVESGALKVAWNDREHDAAVSRLTGAMSRDGFVWRAEDAGDEDPKDNPRAVTGKGEIINLAWERLKWSPVNSSTKDLIDRPINPRIMLHEAVAGHLPSEVLGREFLGELGRFEAELPAGSLATFRRLAVYAQELYDEDHVGTKEPPGKHKGTAQAERRREGPQEYTLTVWDRLGMYRAEVVVIEQGAPHTHLIAMSLRRPD